MGLDIKFPIGLMFSIFGVLLTFYGIFTASNIDMYKKSLEVNINLWTGVPMLVFGLLMLVLSRRTKKAKNN
jgi:prolipoprotein diacylglyceryltransferase